MAFEIRRMASVLIVGCLFVGASLGAAENQPAASNKDSAKKSPTAKGDDATAKPPAEVENPFPNRQQAPSLEGGIEWLNTSGEITLKDLRGKVVLLDFWTYCCINCMHVLPDLKYLEHKYPKEVVVLGVHSAKFDNEKDSEAIRQAIVRYEIEHPVINDANMTVWRKFGARGWPHLVVVDPEGYFCGFVSGEGNRELLDAVIGRLVAYHRSKGTLDETPVRFDLERAKQKPTPLKYPGKILADEAGNRLFISDSNHNRIVVTTLAGELIDIIGNGAIGLADGSYTQAAFDHPQGMALVGETLYVADTENHVLRTVDLQTKTVATLAGTGKQSRVREPGGELRETALNSPWTLTHVNGTLYIAMAGPHQLWSHKLGSSTIQVYAGSGREDILDGSLSQSALAQPSGIATDGKFLYVADSEGSSIRKIPVDPNGKVTTVVGAANLPNGRTLFEFGDIDGIGEDVRLQHPLGVALAGQILYVADSYNHKIKVVNLKTREAKTWLGTGKAGLADNPVQFSEPAGLTIANGTLFIADTNNHRIRKADLKTGKVTDLTIAGLQPPKIEQSVAVAPTDGRAATEVPEQSIAPAKAMAIEITLDIPAGYKLNELAPLTVKLSTTDKQTLIAMNHLNVRARAKFQDGTARVSIPLASNSGKAKYELALTYGYCRDGVGGLCKLKTSRWLVPVVVAAGAKDATVRLNESAAE